MASAFPTRFGFAVLTSATLFASVAFADEQRVRGTIDSLNGNTLTVATREGKTAAITLTEGWKVTGVANATMDDVGEGDFVGIASAPMEDGSDGALEVLIFPKGMEGTGEGSYPWDLQPDSTMTNATVADKVESVDGNSVSVTYDGGQTKDIVIPEGTPVVTFAEATPADLVKGATVFVPVEQAAGKTTSSLIVVGKNGVVPPM